VSPERKRSTARAREPAPVSPAGEPVSPSVDDPIEGIPTGDLPTDDVPLLSNTELARIFYEIGDLLEIKGELVYKAVAYRRVADAIERAPVDVARAYREHHPPKLTGVGSAIGEKLQELADTGRLRYLERLRGEVPRSLLELLAVPGVGPRTVYLLHERLGVTNLEDLRAAAESGALRDVRGMTERTEQAILNGIAGLERLPTRMLLGQAARLVEKVSEALAGVPGLVHLEAAGSFRRRVPTIGDIDLLAASTEPRALAERFVTMASVEKVLARGPHKSAVVLNEGRQVDLMIAPPAAYGTFLVHFTGAKAHNVRLRGIARERGWTLSEHGFARLGPDGEPLGGDAAELRTFPDEESVYRFLDLPWIEPELREDRGEIEAAMKARGADGRLPARPRRGGLPHLIELADLRGDCHVHSEWTDGVYPIEVMAEAARQRGYSWIVLTDHSVGLGIARGLSPDRMLEQREVVRALNQGYEAEEREGRAPAATPADGFRILHGVELEIRADATLDFEDEVLASFDVVVASLHVGRRQTSRQLTDRVLAAIGSPHVDIIAHPSGRMLTGRDELPLEWDTLYEAAARSGTLLEINGSDNRLDLDDERARRARDMGCRLVISSDAHRINELDFVAFGVDMARRGWIAARDVANTGSRDELLAWVAGKPERITARGPATALAVSRS
jgi:DNA polymerase (family 10)